MDFKNKRIFFLGDSITEGACATAPEFVYHQVAGRILGAETLIDGIGGTRIAPQHTPSAVAVYDKNFLGRIDAHGDICDFAVVFGGVNDFAHGDAPFGELGDCSADSFSGAVKLLAEKVKSKYGSNAAFILPMHNNYESNPRGEFGKKPIAGKILREYRERIRETVSAYGFYILDLWNEDELNPNIPESVPNFADGLHPTDKGHAILGEKVAEFLKSV